MKFSRGAIALYMGLVFVCGGVLGFYANRLYTVSTNTNPTAGKTPMNPEEYRRNAIAEYKRRLNLNNDQVLQLNLIFDETRARSQAEFKEQRDRTRPELEKIRQDQVDRIKAILTVEQRTEYEKFRQERRLQLEKNKENKEKNGIVRGGPGF